MEKLFTYGTLQLTSVQQETFGKQLKGEKDELVGYKLEKVLIKNEDIVEISGLANHPIAVHTGNSNDTVSGVVFELTEDELKKSDEYEVSQYKREEVSLKSGVKAWVYVK